MSLSVLPTLSHYNLHTMAATRSPPITIVTLHSLLLIRQLIPTSPLPTKVLLLLLLSMIRMLVHPTPSSLSSLVGLPTLPLRKMVISQPTATLLNLAPPLSLLVLVMSCLMATP